MKQFFGAFFGSIIGLAISALIIGGIIAAVISTSISSLKDTGTKASLKENSILKLEFNDPIIDRQKKEDPIEELIKREKNVGLNALIKKINYAKTDDKIKGIYLSFKSLNAGFATLNELRDALEDFKTSGKFIYSYSENYTQGDYYLASVSNKVFLNPQGNFIWKGLSANLMFFKKMFEKLDIEMQIFRHGKFKSAVEPFMSDKMSAANRQQYQVFLGSIWKQILADISKSRNISSEELNRLANNLHIQFPEDAVNKKMIDAAAYEDEVIAELKKKIGLKESDKYKFVNMADYEAKAKKTKDKEESDELKSNKIAVIYAVGEIGGGEGNDETIGSDRIARAIKEARLNDKIKAIVLRVNSPGGSALASDVIWREVTLAKKEKPFVVSMGDLAASGGYYISCAADRIFAQPNTITGSIGVFGVVPNIQKTLENKLGITTDTVKTNSFSDFFSGVRSLSEFERDKVQTSVERIYDTFTKLVAQGRGMTQSEVDSIGQGRVWSGTDALKIKLVDELGGLHDAIAYAAKQAKIENYKLEELPKQTSLIDQLTKEKQEEFEEAMLKKNLGSAYMYLKQVRSVMNMKGVQARLPFEMVVE
ncbi:MAG: signal peptide peptidase SppA [Bacteroidetes bacterium]|nr:signal peptide peptidase SppA [Bacteroidota bacterium]